MTQADWRLTDAGELFVAVLDRGFGGASADEENPLPVRGRDEGVHPQVYADDGLLRARGVRYFTDDADGAIGEPHFHEAPGQRHRIRHADAERAALPVGQDQSPVANAGILVGVDHIVIAAQAPGIARLGLAVSAQLATRIHRLAELADELLGALRGQARIAPPGCTAHRCQRALLGHVQPWRRRR